ncbi:MAG: Rrf2 family transcriptional regulator [Rickettsiales bacterium]|jgi:Rrf2 family protein
MLSMKAKYALRALMVMAKNEKKMLAAKTIAKEADIPQKFLENILQELRHHGIVDSKRGIFGGYFLVKPAAEISVGDLIRMLDGPLAPIRCASLTAYQKCDDCADENTCEIRHTMMEVRNAISNVLDTKSLLEMMGKI